MNKNRDNRKILLMLLPFWSPLVPPMGITCLKTYCAIRGFDIKTHDANTKPKFRQIYQHYLDTLEQGLTMENRGNFRKNAARVLQKHLDAHLNRQDNSLYKRFINTLFETHYFQPLSSTVVSKLDQLVDQFFETLRRDMHTLLQNETPDIIGFSLFSDTLPSSLFAARCIKEMSPDTTIIVGGGIFTEDLAPGSFNYEHFIVHTPFIDKIFVGEGERLLINYLNNQLPETQRVYSTGNEGKDFLDLQENPNIEGFSSCHHSVPFSDYELDFYPYLSTYTSRSCPHGCSFCSEANFWGPYRKRPVQQVAEEMTVLYNTYHRQLFLMCDSLLNPIISSLSDALHNKETSVYWDGYLRADPPVCNVENTFKWRRAGFYRARLGLESASLPLLEKMGKRITPQQMKDAVSALAAAGIKTTTYWVIGHPGESKADFQATLDFLDNMKDDIYEADCSSFSFFQKGQVNSDLWFKGGHAKLLYPPWSESLQSIRTWYLETEPFRPEIHQRVQRFITYCRQLGIPNPNTLEEINRADQRWRHLHSNAVPALLEFQQKQTTIQENKTIQQAVPGKNISQQEAKWDF